MPSPDVKDKIIAEVAYLIRQYAERDRSVCGDGDWFWDDVLPTLNSYGDTLMPEEVLSILKSLPGRK